MENYKLGKLTENKTGKFTKITPVNIQDIKKGEKIVFIDDNVMRHPTEFLEIINKDKEGILTAMEEPVYNEKEHYYYLTILCNLIDGGEIEDILTFPAELFGEPKTKRKVENNEPESIQEENIENLFPKKILAHLDKYVVGQEDAKKKLSIEIFKHYCRMNSNEPENFPKDNILLTGPTGCGKTYMLEILAKLIDVPFAKCSCTSLTESGYVGDDVETVLQDLLKAANWDVEKAEFGIVFLDEIDKIGRKSENPSITRDVSGEGVQSALLTMLGGTTMRVPTSGSRKHPHAQMIDFDTSNVLFIGAGCFEGIEEIVKNKKGTNKKSIGFSTNISTEPQDKIVEENNLRKEITKEDLKKFGLIPELLGRFNILANLLELDKEALINICKLNNGEINKYKNLFSMFGKNLILNDEVYEKLAENALTDKTGARGVKSALSELLTEYTYNIDNDTDTEIKINVA